MAGVQNYPILPFASQSDWRTWLEKNHVRSNGVWLQFYKKGSGVSTVVYAEALEEALCYGWIDGQLQKKDEDSYLQKFTPRRARSGWSKKNTEHVARLMAAGKMQPAGLAEVEAAKRDGRWEKAYESPQNANPPEDFLEELNRHKKAKEFFATLNKANVYAIVYRLQTAKKEETRAKRMGDIIAMLERGEMFHVIKPKNKK